MSHDNPICRSICAAPKVLMPCRTGKRALKPIATNMKARKGLQAGVRKRGNSTTTIVAAPIVVIYVFVVVSSSSLGLSIMPSRELRTLQLPSAQYSPVVCTGLHCPNAGMKASQEGR